MLSIVIINYFTRDLTTRCVRSILEFPPSCPYEIIIVDNGSNPGDAAHFSAISTVVRIVGSGTNIGFARGNNLGISHSKGEYICLLNSDTELIRPVFDELTGKLATHPEIGVISCQLCYPDGTPQKSYQSFPSALREFLEATKLHKLVPKLTFNRRFNHSALDANGEFYCDWVWGTCFVFRKNDLSRLKDKQLHDELFMYGEDMDWCFQFREAGLRVFHMGSQRIVHHVGKSAESGSDNNQALLVSHELYALSRHRSTVSVRAFRLFRRLNLFVLGFRNAAFRAHAAYYIHPVFPKLNPKTDKK